MRAFSYISSRQEKSLTNQFTLRLLSRVSDMLKVDIEAYTATSTNISECQGCNYCFTHGKCLIEDDMQKIKQSMLNSDIIVLGSPVYMCHVTGNMKTFIDRISYWTHIFRLIGKTGICINVSSNNGNSPTSDYLNFVLEGLGVSVIGNISLQHRDFKYKSAYESIVEIEAKKIVDRLKMKDFRISQNQEQSFNAMKRVMTKESDNSPERQYWLEHNYFDCPDFRTLFNREVKSKYD